jgi:transposase-like protein
MILNALVERLKRRSKGDFKGRHFEGSLILQAVSWYLRYPLTYRDIEEPGVNLAIISKRTRSWG